MVGAEIVATKRLPVMCSAPTHGLFLYGNYFVCVGSWLLGHKMFTMHPGDSVVCGGLTMATLDGTGMCGISMPL